jgi:hypothetical protein
LSFRLQWRGQRIVVDISQYSVTYRTAGDEPVTILHAGDRVEVLPDEPQTRPLVRREPLLGRPTQPPGREPQTRMPLRADVPPE